MKFLLILLSLLLATAALAVGVASAAGADVLDPAFGVGGVVRLAPPEGAESTLGPTGVSSFGPAADGPVYVLGNRYECDDHGGQCEYVYSLGRYESDGSRDEAFGGAGPAGVPLPGALRYSVTADEGAALVVGFAGKGVVLRRFTADGAPDPSFGSAGVARVRCACSGEAHLRVLIEPDDKILIEVDSSARPGISYENGTLVRLTRLLPDGSVDRGFGTAGTARFKIHGPGAPTSAVAAAGDATLIGGSGFAFEDACCGRRHIYLRRVLGDGRLDRPFDRNVTRSLKRLEIRGRFPTLTAVVKSTQGTIDLLGYAGEEGGGFDLRLHADGRPVADFGTRGVRHLPFTVAGAVRGVDGAIFAVGAPGRYSELDYHAFRILAGGGLDPAYRRGKGIAVPITGVRMGLTALEGGRRVLVTDNGDSYCRYACPPNPTMVRFLE
jgi:hypothetical protein